jgi:hypothetical protein
LHNDLRSAILASNCWKEAALLSVREEEPVTLCGAVYFSLIAVQEFAGRVLQFQYALAVAVSSQRILELRSY